MGKKINTFKRFEKFFGSKSNWESTILVIIVLFWLTPIMVTYFILKFGIIIPIGNLLGGKKKK